VNDAKVQVTIQMGVDTLSKVKRLAAADSRSLSSFLDMLIRNAVMGKPVESSLSAAARAPGRQVDITDAIAEAVKRGPVRKPK
jgi:hypothetical protein